MISVTCHPKEFAVGEASSKDGKKLVALVGTDDDGKAMMLFSPKTAEKVAMQMLEVAKAVSSDLVVPSSQDIQAVTGPPPSAAQARAARKGKNGSK